MISVVVLQNSMDLLEDELGSSSETCVTSTLVGNQVTGIEAVWVTDIKKEEDEESVTIPEIKTEPKVRCVPVVSVCIFVTSYIQNYHPLYRCVLVKQRFDCRGWILSCFKEKKFLFCNSLHVKYHLQWNVSSINKSNIPQRLCLWNVTSYVEGITCFEEL